MVFLHIHSFLCILGSLAHALGQAYDSQSSWNTTAYTNANHVISGAKLTTSTNVSWTAEVLTSTLTTAILPTSAVSTLSNATTIFTSNSVSESLKVLSSSSNGSVITRTSSNGTAFPTIISSTSLQLTSTPSATDSLTSETASNQSTSSDSGTTLRSAPTSATLINGTTLSQSSTLSVNGTMTDISSSMGATSSTGTSTSSTELLFDQTTGTSTSTTASTANLGSDVGGSTTISTTTSSTSGSPAFSTVTASSASTQSLSTIQGVTTNTHITSTDSDGHQTVVPVLWGCTFCGGGGIELFGFGPGPGVYVWPPVPSFSGLPPVTLNDNDDPSVELSTEGPKSTQTSTTSTESSSCTESTTAEDLYVTCYAATTSGLTTTTASCETSTSTIIGCDLTATAITTMETATTTCWSYSLTGDHVPVQNDDDSNIDDSSGDDDATANKKRNIAGRIEYEIEMRTSPNPGVQVRSLLKRADSWSTFGSCDVGTSILVPPWPNAKAFQLQKLITDGKVQQDQWWYRVNQKSCPEVSEIYYDATFLRGQPLTQVNVDHAFEKAIPAQFLNTMFTSDNQDQCTTFKDLFVNAVDKNYPSDYKPGQADPNKANQNRLQSLFYMVPNKINYKFIGVDVGVNGMKGAFFNPGLEGIRKPRASGTDKDVEFNLNAWNLMGMAIDFLKLDAVQRVYAEGQNEIYGAFVRFDELWGSCNNPMNLAENYQKYIRVLFSDSLASIQAHASQVSNSIVQYATTTDTNGDLNKYGQAVKNLEATYAPSSLAFPTDPYLQFPETTANIQKRQAACTISAAPSTTLPDDTSVTGTASLPDSSLTTTSTNSTLPSATTTSSDSTFSTTSSFNSTLASASMALISSESVASVSSASVASASLASISSASVASVSSASVASVSSVSAASAASVASVVSAASAASVVSVISAESAVSAASASDATATPSADCYLWDDSSIAYAIEVTPINGWTPDGDSLKKQEKGCGALTEWEFGSWINGTQWATFRLPTLIKAGCVERAIASAGGPQGLKCIGKGWFNGYIMEEVRSTNLVLAADNSDVDFDGTKTNAVGPTAQPANASPTASLLPLAVPGVES